MQEFHVITHMMDVYVANLHAKYGSNRLKIKKVTANNVNGVRVLGNPLFITRSERHPVMCNNFSLHIVVKWSTPTGLLMDSKIFWHHLLFKTGTNDGVFWQMLNGRT